MSLVQITHYTCPNYTDPPSEYTLNTLCWKFFHRSGFLINLRLPGKQSLPDNFHCIEYTFCIQDFWATCACPEKQTVPWIHCIAYIFFIFQDFWATCPCPENRVWPERAVVPRLVRICWKVSMDVADVWCRWRCYLKSHGK